jgi:hypothetical protein
LETATTAPTMATSTTPPDTMLSRKFLSDGVSVTASATSGMASAVATAAALSPADTFSFMDARTTAILLAAGLALGGCRGWNGDAAPTGLLSPATETAENVAVEAAMASADGGERRLCVGGWTTCRGGG